MNILHVNASDISGGAARAAYRIHRSLVEHGMAHGLQSQLAVPVSTTAFLGDDLNDLVTRPLVNLMLCPADVLSALRCQADWVLSCCGGQGALRECSDALLAARGLLRLFQQTGWRQSNVPSSPICRIPRPLGCISAFAALGQPWFSWLH